MLLTSQVERDTELFARRGGRMTDLVAELRERTALVAAGGGEKSVERHRSRGKLPARERIDLLVDPDTAFLELSALAAWGVYDDQAPRAGSTAGTAPRARPENRRAGVAPGAGIVTGIGVVEGRECVIVANDATVKGGRDFPGSAEA